MPVTNPAGNRKYSSEMTLLVSLEDAYILRAADLSRVEQPLDPPCHLYMVSSRPRMSIDPASVELTDTALSGVVRLQRGGDYDEYPITVTHPFGAGVEWQSDWPHERFAILDANGERLLSGPVALMSKFRPTGWPQEAGVMDVLYIGQAFGKAGERTAWDRLESHGTVQKILAERPQDREVWLSLLTIFSTEMITEMLPRTGEEVMSDAEDDAHIRLVTERVATEGFADHEAVALAEAGLIRYFQPKYNERLKYNFPARKQVPLETARSLDLHGLIIELQSEESGFLYRTNTQGAMWVHFAGFAIHLDEDRSLTLALASIESVLSQKSITPPD